MSNLGFLSGTASKSQQHPLIYRTMWAKFLLGTYYVESLEQQHNPTGPNCSGRKNKLLPVSVMRGLSLHLKNHRAENILPSKSWRSWPTHSSLAQESGKCSYRWIKDKKPAYKWANLENNTCPNWEKIITWYMISLIFREVKQTWYGNILCIKGQS